jgi:hypothetical protein
MAIIELLFLILKTIVLSTIYSSIILLTLILFFRIKDSSILLYILNQKLKFWLGTHFIISLGLFIFSFTYSQDTGLGDNSKIPIGFGQSIHNEDFQWTYFFPDLSKTEQNKDELEILNFKIVSNKICAEVSHENTLSPNFDFVVFDLPTQTLKTFRDEVEYNTYANTNNLPLKREFINFETQLKEYLENRPFWRTWLIP